MSTKQRTYINLRKGSMKPQAHMRNYGYNPYDTVGTAFYSRLLMLAGK